MEQLEQAAMWATWQTVDTAADVYQRGRSVWNDVEDVGGTVADMGNTVVDVVGTNARSGMNMAEREIARAIPPALDVAARPVSWATRRGAQLAERAHRAFDWIAD